MSEFKYWAFITYSHADTKWCEWLHKALETERIPSHLVGEKKESFIIPQKLFPIFRDREELSSASDLGDHIQSALRQSRNLVVICSPNSAKSKWVNEEIRYFKTLGKGERIFCFIVDGEPNASDHPELNLEECYPKTVRFKLTEQGTLASEKADPLAADARKDKDGRRNALLKLIAGILDVNFDTLRQRASERRTRFLALVSISLLALVVVLLLLTWTAFNGQQQAVQNQSQLLLQTALYQIENDDSFEAKNNLAQAVELDANNSTAIARLVTLLTQRQYPALVNEMALHKDKIWEMDLNPHQGKIISSSHDGSLALVDALSMKDKQQILSQDDINVFTRFSKDGRYIVSISGKGILRAWDSNNYELKHTENLGSRIVDASISDDSKNISIALKDKRLLVWKVNDKSKKDYTDKDKVKTFLELSHVIYPDTELLSITFVDFNALLSTTNDGELVYWELLPNKAFKKILNIKNNMPILKADYSANRKLIATADENGVVKLWNSKNGMFIENAFRYEGTVRHLGFNDTQEYLMCHSASEKVYIWDVDKKLLAPNTVEHKSSVSKARFLRDGENVISASWDGTAKIWGSKSKLPKLEPMRHSSPVFAAIDGVDEKSFFTGSEDGKIRKWVYGNEKFLFFNTHYQEGVIGVKQNKKGDLIAVLSQNRREILLLNIIGQKVIRKDIDAHDTILSIDISDDGEKLLLVLINGEVRVYDIKNKRYTTQIIIKNAISAEYLKDDRKAIIHMHDNSVRIWDMKNNYPVTLKMKHYDSVKYFKPLPGNNHVLTVTYSNQLSLWDANSGLPYKKIENLDYQINAIAASSDGKYVYVASGKNILIYEYVNGLKLINKIPHPETVWAIDISADRKKIVSTCFDGLTRIWHFDNYKKPQVKIRQSGIILNVQFSHNDKWLLTGSNDGNIAVWDANSGDNISEPIMHEDEVIWAKFGAGGKYIISTTSGGDISVTETGLDYSNNIPDWLTDFALTVGDTRFTDQKNIDHIMKRINGGNIDVKWKKWSDKVLMQNYRVVEKTL